MTTANEMITVIGGGAWGAALTASLQHNHSLTVSCLVRDPDTASALQQARVPRLGAMHLPAPLTATIDPQSLAKASAIYIAVPASATSQALAQVTRYASADCPVIFCAKGLVTNPDGNTPLFLPEFCQLTQPSRPFAILSGPSFADEVIKSLPCALVAASHDDNLSARITTQFSASLMRLYQGSDPMGTAICGAVKNVIALAAGICVGLDLGDNAKAALLTRGLAETGRLITTLGGAHKTLTGLAGIGDLSLSAANDHSRNMAYGLALGRGQPLPDQLAEGARTAPLLLERASSLGLDMPLTAAVTAALAGDDLAPIITSLLQRPPTQE